MKKRIIWSDDINLEDWQDLFEEEGIEDEGEQYERACELNNDYLDDERVNLDCELPGRVLCIADLGLWDGRHSGYRLLGSNLNSIFDVEASEWYCDAYNVRGTEHHHDGTNFYEFRLIPDGVDATPLLDALYSGEATDSLIRRYTRSLRHYVSEIYGWGGRKRKKVG